MVYFFTYSGIFGNYDLQKSEISTMNNVEIKQAHTYTIHSIVPSDEKNGMLSFLLGYL